MSTDTTTDQPITILKADRPITDEQAGAIRAALPTQVPLSVLEYHLVQAGIVIAGLRQEVRRFKRLYGRASATIGAERGIAARLRTQLDDARRALVIEDLRHTRAIAATDADVVDRAERWGNDIDARAALDRILSRCDEILAGRYRHIAIGEIHRLIAAPAATVEPAGSTT